MIKIIQDIKEKWHTDKGDRIPVLLKSIEKARGKIQNRNPWYSPSWIQGPGNDAFN